MDMHPDLRNIFLHGEKEDQRILNIAYHTARKQKSRSVILVTKD
jgi:predicted ribonuclease YlaK